MSVSTSSLCYDWESNVGQVLITLAWATALGYFISVCLMMKYGWGSHAWDVTLAEMVYYNTVRARDQGTHLPADLVSISHQQH